MSSPKFYLMIAAKPVPFSSEAAQVSRYFIDERVVRDQVSTLVQQHFEIFQTFEETEVLFLVVLLTEECGIRASVRECEDLPEAQICEEILTEVLDLKRDGVQVQWLEIFRINAGALLSNEYRLGYYTLYRY